VISCELAIIDFMEPIICPHTSDDDGSFNSQPAHCIKRRWFRQAGVKTDRSLAPCSAFGHFHELPTAKLAIGQIADR
jgi:hypothetical protein